MPYYPTISESATSQQITDTFLGYNHNLKIIEGESYEERNLTTDFYPLLANRKRRGIYAEPTNPLGILGKGNLAYIDGTKLYYGGTDITSYLTAKGVSISADSGMLPKQMISMGAYIIIYPDKIYINTEDYSDCGSIDAVKTINPSVGTGITYTMCKVDGGVYPQPTISDTPPDPPSDGMLWIDSSSTPHVLKQYSSYTAQWAVVPSTYVRIEYSGVGGIGAPFEVFDGVSISGASADGSAVADQIDALNGSQIIYDKGDDYIVVTGLLDQAYTQTTGSLTVSRRMPLVDYLVEADNRLWGCRYGPNNDGDVVNEIYCSALGDFKNWNKFLGISTDSYVASVGTDGKFTGAITHMGYPLFWKENYLHKVYVSTNGAHQIVDTACRGVQDGCSKSLAIVNETLYFKARVGICAYDGSLPVSVNEVFGTERYSDAVAGAYENKYYVSMKDTANVWHLFCLDTAKQIWHHEDNTHATDFTRCRDELFFINDGNNKIMGVNGSDYDLELGFEDEPMWSATTGLIGYMTVEQKYVTRLNLRMVLPRGSMADMYIQYDSDGLWHFCGHMDGVGTQTFMLPVRPRRCDHFRFRIEGRGDIRVYSMSKIYEVGSDG